MWKICDQMIYTGIFITFMIIIIIIITQKDVMWIWNDKLQDKIVIVRFTFPLHPEESYEVSTHAEPVYVDAQH